MEAMGIFLTLAVLDVVWSMSESIKTSIISRPSSGRVVETNSANFQLKVEASR